MRVEITRATLRDASFVAVNMRQQDRREIGCLSDLSNPAAFAAAIVSASQGWAYCAHLKGQPVAAFGCVPILPRVGSAWAYGTPAMVRAVPAISRFMRHEFGPALIESGITRVEVRTIEDHDISHKWLAALGARCETEPYECGANGERFVTYAWSANNWS
jgi:hypothetical protein